MSILIDKEFESLIPPLSAEEFQQLEENCLRDGIRDALIVWEQDGNDILIDGHNRFRIVGKHPTIHFDVKRMQFADRDEVKLWIIRNQLGRRNLNSFSRSELAIQGKELIAKKAKEKQAEYHGNQHDGLHQKSDKEQVITAKELGKIAGVSHDTIHKVETIKKSGDEKLIEEVRNGDVSINKGYQIATGKEIKTKSPAKAKQERIDRAKEEHAEFKESKTVSIAQAQMDKANRQIIASNLYARLLNVGKRIEDVYTEMAHGDIVTDDENTKYLAEIGLVQVAQSVLWADGWRSVAEGYFMSLHACEDLRKLKIMHRNASNRVYVAVDVDGEVQECIAKQMTIQGIDNEDLIEEQDREDLLTDLESRAI